MNILCLLRRGKCSQLGRDGSRGGQTSPCAGRHFCSPRNRICQYAADSNTGFFKWSMNYYLTMLHLLPLRFQCRRMLGINPGLDLNTSCTGIGLLFYLLLAQRIGPLGYGGSKFEPGRGSGASVGLIINVATPRPLLSNASTPLIHASSISWKWLILDFAAPHIWLGRASPLTWQRPTSDLAAPNPRLGSASPLTWQRLTPDLATPHPWHGRA
jgi:hypothetical protein